MACLGGVCKLHLLVSHHSLLPVLILLGWSPYLRWTAGKTMLSSHIDPGAYAIHDRACDCRSIDCELRVLFCQSHHQSKSTLGVRF